MKTLYLCIIKNIKKMKNIYIVLFLALLFCGCEPDEKINTPLTINFSHTIDGERIFSCCTDNKSDSLLPYTNVAGQNYNVETLKYIISNIKIHDSNNQDFLLKDIHFVDASNTEYLSIEFNNINSGSYNKISFTFGLDSINNIDNKYLNEDWHSSMVWPNVSLTNQPGGYHYMKLEGSYDTIIKSYNCHTGPTIGNDYSFHVELPINFNTDMNERFQLSIEMNINNWFEDPNNFTLTSNGIMGNTNAQVMLKENGTAGIFLIQ